MIVTSSGWPDFQLLEAAPILIWRAGSDGLCDWFNPSWLAYTGRTLDQERGNGWTEGLHPEDFDRCLAVYLDAFGRRAAFKMEYRIMRACGRYGWIVDYGIPTRDDRRGFLGYVGYCFDITDRREAEAKLDASCHDLARSNADLEEFAYAVSHDLREPVRMMTSYATLLLRRYGDRLDPQGQEFLDFIHDGAKRMDAMIRDLLAYSRVERQGDAMQPFALAEALGLALSNLAQTARDSGAVIEAGLDRAPPVRGDLQQIARLFQNLIGNAIKYCAAGVTPRIRVAVEATDDDGRVAVTVADNGIGIPEDSREEVFKLFHRLNALAEREGTGVGLSIARKIVERHGGSIGVAPAEGGGSVFRFTLPCA
ncbi:MAG: hypothetical protein RLZZ501_2589 [Pseudomonadota bacterium]|jgi:PAS domain S-box-containing protein